MKAAGALCALVLWSTAQASTVTYVYSDPQGTPLAEADANGNITATFDYRPYGAQALGQPPSGPGYTGHVNDPDTGLVYMQARYYDPSIGRFLSTDPVTAYSNSLGAFNRYWYANNNPYKFIDPDGREVFIVITRDTYTNNSVTSTISVTSDRTDKSFSGFTLEDSRGGQNRNKDPILADTYASNVRTDGKKGWRIELEPKNNYKNVQIHVGNTATDVEGCFAAGTGRSEDKVSNSKKAISEIRSVVDSDGSGKITVVVQGRSTAPPTEQPPPPPPPAPIKDQLD